MSLFNGKLPRRVAAVLGSACFLGGLSIAASSANAGIFVSLKPTAASVTALGGTLAGDIFTGYTLTVPPGTYNAGQLQVDLETAITDTNAGGTGVTALLTLRGAVKPALVSGTPTVAATTGFAFSSTIDGQALRADVFAQAKPGTVDGPAGLQGLGHQAGSFGSSDSTNAVNDLKRFEIQTSLTTNDSVGVPAPLVVGGTAVRVGGASFNTSGIAGDSLTLTVAGGGVTASSTFAQYFTDFDAAARPATIQLGVAADSKPLTINFAVPAPLFLLGDFNGDGAFDTADIEGFVAGISEGDPFAQLIADNEASFLATYGVAPTAQQINEIIGDFNFDLVFDTADIEGFVLALSGGRGVASAIPEPMAMSLLVPAGLLAARRRR
jgi:hypothetical protein